MKTEYPVTQSRTSTDGEKNHFFSSGNGPTSRFVLPPPPFSGVDRGGAFTPSVHVGFGVGTSGTELPGGVRSDCVSDRLAGLKSAALRNDLGTATHPMEANLIRAALNEAEAIAWASPFPSLLFPELAGEKVAKVRAHFRHQQEIWNRGSERMALAA